MGCGGKEDEEDAGRSGEEEGEDLGRGEESSLIVELKINTILGDIF